MGEELRKQYMEKEGNYQRQIQQFQSNQNEKNSNDNMINGQLQNEVAQKTAKIEKLQNEIQTLKKTQIGTKEVYETKTNEIEQEYIIPAKNDDIDDRQMTEIPETKSCGCFGSFLNKFSKKKDSTPLATTNPNATWDTRKLT